MTKFLLLSMLFSFAFVTMPANAAIVFDLAFRAPGRSASFDQTISLNPSDVITGIELVLIETVTGGTQSIFGDDTNMMGAGGINNRSGNLSSYRADLTVSGSDGSFANLTANLSGGNEQFGTNDADTVAYWSLGNFFGQPGILAAETGVGMREIVLGTVDLTAPSFDATTFLVSDVAGRSDFTTFSTGSLEQAAIESGGSFNSRSLTLNAAAVPEPSSVLLLAIGGIAITLRRRRSKRGASTLINAG